MGVVGGWVGRTDMTSGLPLSPVGVGGCGWVWVSHMEELRKPFLSLYGMGMREDIHMIE